jgi:histidine triad (HIT) family protein
VMGEDARHTASVTTSAEESPCLFCDIIARREESSLVHADEHVVAFMDIEPVTQGHLLVVPRTHADSLEVLSEELGARVFQVAHRLARALYRSGPPCEGVNMFLADGRAAFQEVFHVHLHVLPRTPVTASASTRTGAAATAKNSTPRPNKSASASGRSDPPIRPPVDRT